MHPLGGRLGVAKGTRIVPTELAPAVVMLGGSTFNTQIPLVFLQVKSTQAFLGGIEVTETTLFLIHVFEEKAGRVMTPYARFRQFGKKQ
jgi:hypothetical protein